MAISFDNISPKLDKILEQTYGQLIFQEQVTEIAQQLAGWTAGQADKLRKAIGRKIPEEMAELIPKLHKAFVDYGKITDEQADMLCTGIQNCASYSFNKCLAGSERIMRAYNGQPYTIEEMYKIRQSYVYANERGQSSLHWKYKRGDWGQSYSRDEDGFVVRNVIKNIEFSGIREVYEVKLETGEKVKCTLNHKFPTPDGDKTVSELQIGDSLFVIKKRPQLNYGFMVGEGTNLPKKGERGFQTKKQAPTKEYDEYRDLCVTTCKPCDICRTQYNYKKRFEVHHKDSNRANNDISNLNWLCNSCHKKEHYKIGRRKMGGAVRYFEAVKIISISYAGVENTYSVEMFAPYHNFTLLSGIVSSNSHSVEYGLIAYMTAYLKANYPLEYMCALLNANSDSEEDIVKYKAECERMGIEILPPSVKVGNLNYIPENGNIRMGLNSIKGINDLKTDFFANFDDYISKNVNFNKRIKEALIKSGACDCFGLSRKEMLLRALNVYKDIKAYDTKISNSYAKLGTKISELQEKKDGTKIKANLAKQIENLEATIARYVKERNVLVGLTQGEYNEVEGEKEVLGFTFQDEFKYYDTSKFPLYSERVSVVQTFWANIISVKTIKDKNGNLMAFVSAVPYKHKQKVEFVVFASTYKKITTPIVEGVALLKVNKKNQLVDWVEGKNV